MGTFLPFLLILLALSLVFRVDIFFVTVWFLAGLLILGRLWMQQALGRLAVARRFPARAFVGDRVTVNLTVRNGSRLPIPWLEVEESLPMELRTGDVSADALSLGPREERHFPYTLTCRRRGYYTLGPLRIETGDLLGLERRELIANEPNPLIVYPRVVPLPELGLPTRSALVTLPGPSPLFEDPSRIVGVRDYRPGDSPRRIHWPATARTGRLAVKQYQPAIARETLLCLDLDSRDYDARARHDAAEMAVVVAASLAHHMIVREGLPAGLATIAGDPLQGGRRTIVLPPHAQRGALLSMLEVLARVQLFTPAGSDQAVTSGTQVAPGSTPPEDFAGLLRRQSTRVAWGATIVAITGSIDGALAETLVYLQRTGHAVAVVLVQPPGAAGAAVSRIPIHRVWSDRDLAGIA